MSDKEVDHIEEAEKIKRKPGRPKGSKNKNYEYKEKKRQKEKAIKELWKRGILHWKLDSMQKEMREAYYNRGNNTNLVWLLSRQVGKCLIEGTKVMTPNGVRNIEDLEIGDQVIGYNSDGTTSPTNVINKIDSGQKEVYDLYNRSEWMGGSTDDHVWLTTRKNGDNEIVEEAKLGEFKTHSRIVRKFYDTPMGNIHVPDAYVLGALIGDGCSREGVKRLHISSENELIPKAIGDILRCHVYKQKSNNFTWVLSNDPKNIRSKERLKCSYYDEWVKDRYAHEKILDYEVVRHWDRKSILKLIAGLIDTDGSVHIPKAYNTLTIQLSMQAKGVIDTIQKLVYDMFQYQAKIIVDNRSKYVNGPVYNLKLNHNLFSKRILKELDQYLVTPKKKWKKEYETLLDNNICQDYVGVKKKNKRIAQCWDITVDNDTSLYLTGDGLVTHNSWTVCTIILEEALKNPGFRMAYVAPQQNQARRIVKKTMQELLQDCPDNMRPTFKTQEGLWRFPNGSELYVVGSDGGNIESIRGMTFNRVFVDEFCFLDDFGYCMNSVLFPTMTTINDPIMVMISSPPKTHDHESNLWIDRAEETGTLFTKTIYDCPRFTQYQIEKIIENQYFGDPHSIDFRREYMAERIPDIKSLVLPEASRQKMQELTQEWQRPKFYNCIISADWGVMDNNFVLFAYYDFMNNKIIIEDELEINGVDETTSGIAEKIISKEEQLWLATQKRLRVCDNNLQLINDLTRDYNLPFRATAKDNLQAAVNEVRSRIASDEIIINPRCTRLIAQMKSAMWDRNRKKFKRAKDHHYDGVAALIYLVRNIDTRTNPFPPGWNFQDGAFISPKWYAKNEHKSQFHKTMDKIFTVKRGKKRK